jgi:hypothetical protein
MTSGFHNRIVALVRRLSIGRILRYADLWVRYVFRRGASALRATSDGAKDENTIPAALHADFTEGKRLTVCSWFPIDEANSGLHQAILAGVAGARAELGLSPDIIERVMRLKGSSDLAAAVDAEVAQGAAAESVNTALYILLLRRLPAPSEQAMIASRHPRTALIAIRSGDEYRKQGRRLAVS